MIIKSSTEFYIDLVCQLSDTVRHILILLLDSILSRFLNR